MGLNKRYNKSSSQGNLNSFRGLPCIKFHLAEVSSMMQTRMHPGKCQRCICSLKELQDGLPRVNDWSINENTVTQLYLARQTFLEVGPTVQRSVTWLKNRAGATR